MPMKSDVTPKVGSVDVRDFTIRRPHLKVGTKQTDNFINTYSVAWLSININNAKFEYLFLNLIIFLRPCIFIQRVVLGLNSNFCIDGIGKFYGLLVLHLRLIPYSASISQVLSVRNLIFHDNMVILEYHCRVEQHRSKPHCQQEPSCLVNDSKLWDLCSTCLLEFGSSDLWKVYDECIDYLDQDNLRQHWHSMNDLQWRLWLRSFCLNSWEFIEHEVWYWYLLLWLSL